MKPAKRKHPAEAQTDEPGVISTDADGLATPDFICQVYGDKGIKMTVREVKQTDGMILIEGKRAALEFLGRLLLAQARSEDCGFQLSPRGAGRGFFGKASTKGVYIHRLPCRHRPKA
jgi:hypothetical protein